MQNRVQILAFDQDNVILVGGAVGGISVNTSARFNGYLLPTDNANSSKAQWTRYFIKGGLYKVRYIYRTGNDSAKVDIGLDSSTNNIFSQIDQYTSSAVNNNIRETLIEISRGYHTVSMLANGKNASSINYTMPFHAFLFDLIQEYPVYQDDQPMVGLEGDEIVLYKTVLSVAGSSISIPLAAVDIINKYSEIEVVLDTLPSASANLTLAITGGGLSGSVYYGNAVKVLGTTVTGVSFSAAASWTLADTSVISGGSEEVFARAIISGTVIGGGNYRLIWQAGSGTIGDIRGSGGASASVSGTITNVTLTVSSGNFPVGTSVVIHGRKKK